METGELVLNEFQDRSWRWHRDAAIALLLTVLAFAVRLNHVDFNSLSEDESAKWAAVQEYRHGHFVGVNSEHPMMLKVLAWVSLTAGERWNRLASLHSWPTMSPERGLRFPNVLLGVATSAILFLFFRGIIGFMGAFARCFLVILLSFILVNPVVLFPSNFSAILHWLHHDGVRHSGYDFNGTLYLNFPSRLFAGVPWTFYLWLLLIKTPIPILVAVIAGSIMLLRDRRTLASCFFLSLGVVQLAGLWVSGAKWVRYSLVVLPFLFLAGGYAVQATWDRMREKKMSLAFVGLAAATLFALPLLELHAWSPYYSFYLNSIGGGQKNIARYFGQDEVSEFDTREVAQQVCSSADAGVRLATARPMTLTYYVENCGRTDIEVVPLYDRHYVPREVH